MNKKTLILVLYKIMKIECSSAISVECFAVREVNNVQIMLADNNVEGESILWILFT